MHFAPTARLKPVSLPPNARILVKSLNWLGDIVMSLPALWAVRLRYPQAHLAVLVREELASFYTATPWIDRIIPYPIAGQAHRWRRRWNLIRNLARERWDAGIVLPRSFESALWFALARIPIRIGVAAQARSSLLTHPLGIDLKQPDRHLTESYLLLVCSGLDCGVPPAQPALLAPSLEQPFALHGPYVVMAPGAAFGPAKQWPLWHWQELSRALARKNLHIVLVGTESERPLCEEIRAAIPAACSTLAGKTNLPQLMAVIAHGCAFVGNDSGATHLAAALGVRTVALFGSTNPLRTAPRGSRCRVLYDPPPCSPCLQRTCRFGHYDCLARITPDRVLAAIDELGYPG
ncbi:MAG: ADP-heptose--LPS heptosyltransferase [Candidatus Binatia bacterium]|nr:MAG: ADP-heptose--LPS heptosyltransferase [Candidatus Binatia bacterium]